VIGVVVLLQLICDPVICQIVASIKVEMPESSALLSSGILKVMKWVQDCIPIALMFVGGITCIPFWILYTFREPDKLGVGGSPLVRLFKIL
jgi:hypothetical protein